MVLNLDNAETRSTVESCYRTTSTLINPIIEWTDADVWRFLKEHGCESNPLYAQGYSRIGCIGCPLVGNRKELADYPNYRKAYVRAFNQMLKARTEAGLHNRESWADGERVMRWWLGDDPMQMTIDDWLEEEKDIMSEYVPREWMEKE